MKQIRNTGELLINNTEMEKTKHQKTSEWRRYKYLCLYICRAELSQMRKGFDSPVITNTTNNNSWNNSCISVYILSLHLRTKKKQVCFHSTVPPPPSGLCLEKTRCGAGLCLNSSTSNSTAVLRQVRVFFKQTRFSSELLGCRSHAGHEWLHRLESRVPSSPARSKKQKQRQKNKKNTHTLI